MKSLADFYKDHGDDLNYTFDVAYNEYKEYLKHYYSGQALASLIIALKDAFPTPYELSKLAHEYADAMVNELLK